MNFFANNSIYVMCLIYLFLTYEIIEILVELVLLKISIDVSSCSINQASCNYKFDYKLSIM